MLGIVRTTLLAGALSVGALAPASAASFLEKNFWLSGPRYDAVMPSCDHPVALGTIQARFAEKERGFWNSELQILGFERLRQVAIRPWASDTIPRRFCSGLGGDLRRPQAARELLDRRGHRHDRQPPGASSGAWSASTATGPTARSAGWLRPKSPTPASPAPALRPSSRALNVLALFATLGYARSCDLRIREDVMVAFARSLFAFSFWLLAGRGGARTGRPAKHPRPI